MVNSCPARPTPAGQRGKAPAAAELVVCWFSSVFEKTTQVTRLVVVTGLQMIETVGSVLSRVLEFRRKTDLSCSSEVIGVK